MKFIPIESVKGTKEFKQLSSRAQKMFIEEAEKHNEQFNKTLPAMPTTEQMTGKPSIIPAYRDVSIDKSIAREKKIEAQNQAFPDAKLWHNMSQMSSGRDMTDDELANLSALANNHPKIYNFAKGLNEAIAKAKATGASAFPELAKAATYNLVNDDSEILDQPVDRKEAIDELKAGRIGEVVGGVAGSLIGLSAIGNVVTSGASEALKIMKNFENAKKFGKILATSTDSTVQFVMDNLLRQVAPVARGESDLNLRSTAISAGMGALTGPIGAVNPANEVVRLVSQTGLSGANGFIWGLIETGDVKQAGENAVIFGLLHAMGMPSLKEYQKATMKNGVIRDLVENWDKDGLIVNVKEAEVRANEFLNRLTKAGIDPNAQDAWKRIEQIKEDVFADKTLGLEGYERKSEELKKPLELAPAEKDSRDLIEREIERQKDISSLTKELNTYEKLLDGEGISDVAKYAIGKKIADVTAKLDEARSRKIGFESKAPAVEPAKVEPAGKATILETIEPKSYKGVVQSKENVKADLLKSGMGEVEANIGATTLESIVKPMAERGGRPVEEVYGKLKGIGKATDGKIDGKETISQDSKGSISFDKWGRASIKLFEKADVSTIIHESAHFGRRMMKEFADPLLKDAEHLWGVKDGKWSVAQEEQFARDFEGYCRKGEAPKAEMIPLFEQLKKFLMDIYKTIKEMRIKLNPEKREFFDKMLGKDATKQTTKEVTPKVEKALEMPKNASIIAESKMTKQATDMRNAEDIIEDSKAWAKAQSKEVGKSEDLLSAVKSIMDEQGVSDFFIDGTKKASDELVRMAYASGDVQKLGKVEEFRRDISAKARIMGLWSRIVVEKRLELYKELDTLFQKVFNETRKSASQEISSEKRKALNEFNKEIRKAMGMIRTKTVRVEEMTRLISNARRRVKYDFQKQYLDNIEKRLQKNGEFLKKVPMEESGFTRFLRKLESTRKGLLVVQPATTARNIVSSMGKMAFNVLDSAITSAVNVAARRPNAGAELKGSLDAWKFLGTGEADKQWAEVFKVLGKDTEKNVKDILFSETVTTEGDKVGKVLTWLNGLNTIQNKWLSKATFLASIEKYSKVTGKKLSKMDKVEKEDIVNRAMNDALDVTFSNNPQSKAGKALQNLFKSHPLFSMTTTPFIRFVLNVGKFFYDYTPLAMFKLTKYAGEKGKIKFEEAMKKPLEASDMRNGASKAITGMVALGLAYALRQDQKEKGMKWYQFQIGNKVVDLRSYAPFSTYMFFADNLINSMTGRETSWGDAVDATLGISKMFGAPRSIMDMFKQDGWEGYQKTISKLIGDYLGSFTVPLSAVNDLAVVFEQLTTGDTELGKARDVEQAKGFARAVTPIAKNFPGFNLLLPEKKGVYTGESVKPSFPGQSIVKQATGANVRDITEMEKLFNYMGIEDKVLYPKTGDKEIDAKAIELIGKSMSRLGKSQLPINIKRAYDRALKDKKEKEFKQYVLRKYITPIKSEAVKQAKRMK